MSTTEIETILYENVEQRQPLSEERLESLLKRIEEQERELTETRFLLSAIAVYGQDVNLPMVVKKARDLVPEWQL